MSQGHEELHTVTKGEWDGMQARVAKLEGLVGDLLKHQHGTLEGFSNSTTRPLGFGSKSV